MLVCCTKLFPMVVSSAIDRAGLLCVQMRCVAGWGLFDYLPSLGPEGKRAFLQEVWEHFLDGTFKSYVGQPPRCVLALRLLNLTRSLRHQSGACAYDLLIWDQNLAIWLNRHHTY